MKEGQTQTQFKQRTEITLDEFEKKVTIAMAHYEYFNYMSRPEAREKAYREVAADYMVAKQQGTKM